MAYVPEISELRSRVTLLSDKQIVDITDINNVPKDNYEVLDSVRAKIVPLAEYDLISGQQLNQGADDATHFMIIRSRANPDIFQYVWRDVYMPDGTIRQEKFRSLAIKDMDNSRRFMRVMLQLQKTSE